MININNYEIEEVEAKELIVPERLDLIAKLKYIEHRENGHSLDFVKALYKAHIEAFSNGSFTEPGNDSKNSINKYLNTFNNLIDNIKQNGMDYNISVIPVGKNNVILDGAHRVAIAAYFNLKVPIKRFENLSVNFGVEFFRNQLLDEKYIDYLVAEYCKFKDNLYLICVYPEIKENMQISNIKIKNEFKVFYKKKIKVNYENMQNLITKIDSNVVWIDKNNEVENYLSIYLLECIRFSEILELKVNIQDDFNFNYITNNQIETVKITNILLNSNSKDFLILERLNHYNKFQGWTRRKIRNLKHYIKMKMITLAEKVGVDKDLRNIYYYLRDIVK